MAQHNYAPRPISIFVSYAGEDEEFRRRLEVSLATLKREGLVEVWHFRRIVPGQDWEREIDSRLQAADIFLPLVSPDFIASDYCWGKETKAALELQANGKLVIIPLVLRPTDWSTTLLHSFQALPSGARPVASWRRRDDAFLDIATGIRSTIESLKERTATTAAKALAPPPSGPPPDGRITLDNSPRGSRPRFRIIIEWWRSLPPSAQVVIMGAAITATATLLAPLVEELAGAIFPPRTPTPTRSATPTMTARYTRTPSRTPTPIITPSATQTPTPRLCEGRTVAISEVMLIPQQPSRSDVDPKCRGVDGCNEYVELYNWGSQQVQVGDMWIADRGGHAARLIPWEAAFPGIPVAATAPISDSSILNPASYAVILPPAYPDGDRPYFNDIPKGTLVLTLDRGDFIGDGLIAREGEPLDILALYLGSQNEVECVVSTYGTPEDDLEGKSPTVIANNRDANPRGIPEGGGFGGFLRPYPKGPDILGNWVRFYWADRSPGYPPPPLATSSPTP